MSSYKAKDIQVLEGLEPVRKRPGMYIGSTSPQGLHHLVWEILDNSVDEALNGHCDQIEIHINKGNEITVKDNGRGIPVDQFQKPKPLHPIHAGIAHSLYRRHHTQVPWRFFRRS